MLLHEKEEVVLISLARLLMELFDTHANDFLDNAGDSLADTLLLSTLSPPYPTVALALYPLVVSIFARSPALFATDHFILVIELIRTYFIQHEGNPQFSSYPLMILVIEAGKRTDPLSPNPLKETIEASGLMPFLLQPLAAQAQSPTPPAASPQSDSGRIYKYLTLLGLYKAIALPKQLAICVAVIPKLLRSSLALLRTFGFSAALFLAESTGLFCHNSFALYVVRFFLVVFFSPSFSLFFSNPQRTTLC
jgi:hypothetical protein